MSVLNTNTKQTTIGNGRSFYVKTLNNHALVKSMENTELTQNGHIFFLLLHDFSVLSMSSAIETLRIANRISGEKIFNIALCTVDGKPVSSSLGKGLVVDCGLPDVTHKDTIIICGGANIQSASTRSIVSWLRRASRQGARIGGLCTGAYTMARAGILNGKRATIHWENRDSFVEEFPDVKLTDYAFVIDGNRLTTAGGTASIDLMLNIISSRVDEQLSEDVSQQLLYSKIRLIQNTARISRIDRLHLRHPILSKTVQLMEKNVENPIHISILANDAHISTRQLERLFKKHLSQSPAQYYMEIRLNRARNLLLQTSMSVINVAIACGFSSASHFSKNYKKRFSSSPYSKA